MKRFVLVMVLLYGLFCRMYADTKTFVREYYYQASEADSKITAREKSLTEVKKLLLEELGVYMESYVNYTVESEKEHISKDFFTNEIKQISVGVTETKILEENWNGEQYYIKAEISADPSEVVKLLNKTLEKRKADVVIDSLQTMLRSSQEGMQVKSKEIDDLNAKLAEQQRITKNQTDKVDALNTELAQLRQKLATSQQEEQTILNEIESIRKRLQNMTQKAVTNARIGMSCAEVRRLCGEPKNRCAVVNMTYYNYGYLWLVFQDDILITGIDMNDFHGCGSYSRYEYEYYKNYIRR